MSNEIPKKQKEVMFYSENEKMMIGADAVRREERAPHTGQILVTSKSIPFDGGLYRTDDIAEIEHIRKSDSFAIGKIKEITEKEYKSYLTKSRVMTSMASSGQEK